MSSTESTKGPEGTEPQGPDGPRTPDAASEPAAAPAAPAAEQQAASLPPNTAPAADGTGATAGNPAPAAPQSAYGQHPADAAPRPTEHTQVLHGAPAPAPAGAPHMTAPGWHPGAPVPPMYQHPGAPMGPPQRPRGRGKLVAGAIALALIAGGAGGIAGWVIGSGDGATTHVQSVSMDAGTGMTYTEIVAKVRPSVVTIVTDAAEGSGVVYSKDGYIVTNNHVVDGAQSVEVRFSDGTTADASIVATDSTQDLAVIQVSGVDDLTPVTFADSSAVQVGDVAVAIGSPLGLEGTVTTGIVSALDRSMTVSGEQDGGMGQQPSSTLSGLIQTDAAINSGNSGGALVNGDGELIGINTAIATTDSGSIGLGFSIPSTTVKDTVEQLIKNGSVEQGYLGVSVADTDGNGAMVLSVEPDSPAAKAGLQEGDVITAIDGNPVASASEVVAAVQGTSAGTEITITYTRDQQEAETTATLEAS
ncbi:trypsin-like peptidase domain-containing protein [Glycomyces luteolus]|uniref:Trypsin-like peptidase domain-containing protein n=1 Tax=Glycomyces luteolus TaxID=2670330 RepID=A0A9X3P989_9ACTN|nr:trypsin-like peptidase domain-containing protein [Glycomyces luteolus]MDA1359273.1 trypsin-like peptidase domain-containing protein [Glycomyces luteolus]